MKPDTSGHGGADHYIETRYIRVEDKVKALPDPLGGQFTQVLTPEQAEYLARHLLVLAGFARMERFRKYPVLYPDDGPADTPAVVDAR
jgi:hypothetical protein